MTTAADLARAAKCADLQRCNTTQAATITRLEAAVCRLNRALAEREATIAAMQARIDRAETELAYARAGLLPY